MPNDSRKGSDGGASTPEIDSYLREQDVLVSRTTRKVELTRCLPRIFLYIYLGLFMTVFDFYPADRTPLFRQPRITGCWVALFPEHRSRTTCRYIGPRLKLESERWQKPALISYTTFPTPIEGRMDGWIDGWMDRSRVGDLLENFNAGQASPPRFKGGLMIGRSLFPFK